MFSVFKRNNVSFVSYKFFVSPYSFIYIYLKSSLKKEYKRKIKNLINTMSNYNIDKLLIKLNYEIRDWNQKSGFFFLDHKNFRDLDLYLYKLLWKFVKKCHPRRSNTWIYSKYWKRSSRIWKFSYYSLVDKKFYFLDSHEYISTNLNYFPFLLNIYKKYNYKILFNILFYKSRVFFKGVNKVLYYKQKGLCKYCLNPITINNSSVVNKSSGFFLVHLYCC